MKVVFLKIFIVSSQMFHVIAFIPIRCFLVIGIVKGRTKESEVMMHAVLDEVRERVSWFICTNNMQCVQMACNDVI